MTRTPRDIVREQLGELYLQIAVLSAENEALKEQLAQRSPGPSVIEPTGP